MADRKHSHYHADMLSVEDARNTILESFNPLESNDIPAIDSLGLTLAEDLYSTVNIPPFNNSAMDGYAVKEEDIISATHETPTYLKVVGTISAGEIPEFTITNGYCARIMTGAPLPNGADTIIPFEETTEMDMQNPKDKIKDIGIKTYADIGSYVRASGKM